MPASPVPHDDVRRQLTRIVSSARFDRSDLLVRFLRFIVESALSGDANSLKEWVIGAEAYGRGQNFDPRIDSIVRTEARRLRRKLKEYYESEGREDPIVISLPTGTYEPVFRFRSDVPLETPPEEPAEPSDQVDEEAASEEYFSERDVPRPKTWISVLQRLWRMPAIFRYIAVVALTCAAWLVYEKFFPSNLDPVHRIALLPPQYPSNDKDGEELATALIDDLGAKLDAIRDLRAVMPESTVRFMAQTTPSISQVGSQLKVDHFLTAVLEKSGNTWHLTTRLIRVSDQAPVWTGRFDCSWSNVLTDESEILNDLLRYIRSNSAAPRGPMETGRFQPSPEADELYAKAVYALGNFNMSRDRAYSDYARQQLAQALMLNPDFDDARVLLAGLAYEQIWGSPQRNELLAQSRSLLETVLKRSPHRADANALLGGVYWELGQRDRAVELARRALQLGPLNATARRELGRIYAGMGFFESAVIEDNRASALDPSDVTPLGFTILCSYWTGRPNEANDALNKFREWYPGALSDLFAADQQLRNANFEEAGRLISSGRPRTAADNSFAFDIADGLRAALMGNRTEARHVWEQYRNSPPGFWDHLILLAAQIGEADSAVSLIRQNPIYSNYRYLVVERRLAPLRGDPGFQALLFQSYAVWQRDLSRFGSSVPASPPPLPSPEEFLRQH